MATSESVRPKIPQMIKDAEYMALALKASERGRGFTEPNPLVGAVVVKNDKVLAVGYHAAFGLPHAESAALDTVTEIGTTLYATLEPCGHFGKTPPCVDTILDKKVRRVVVAMRDPNPLVSGRGIARLRRNGIDVSVGCLREWAVRLNRHYLKSMTTGIPYIAIRAGMSLDGKLSDKSRRSRWVTSSELRRYSHSLRGEFSAILAGTETVLADNPRLTLRDPHWKGKRFFRVVLDTRNRLPRHLLVFRDQDRFPTIVFSSTKATDRTPKTDHHFFLPPGANGLSLPDVCRVLFRQGITSVLVEGGGKVIDSFLASGLFDEVALFVSPTIIGGGESTTLFASGVDRLENALLLTDMETIRLTSGMIIRGFKRCSPESF
jgi:diaminohydroxyphosphoribosylaminopyrimidine deaminase/5-amino-6-(5-phosphoribosylamino)uracil reductase